MLGEPWDVTSPNNREETYFLCMFKMCPYRCVEYAPWLDGYLLNIETNSIKSWFLASACVHYVYSWLMDVTNSE